MRRLLSKTIADARQAFVMSTSVIEACVLRNEFVGIPVTRLERKLWAGRRRVIRKHLSQAAKCLATIERSANA